MLLEQAKRDPFKINGVVIGIVIDNKDPEKRYRVKVKYPWALESDTKYTEKKDDEDFRSSWCRITSMFAGTKKEGEGHRGAFFLPEVDDEVLIAFEHGDLRRPYIIGSLWNGVDVPPDDNDSQDGKNTHRSIVSRSGHTLQFVDDAEGKERIIMQNLVQDKDTRKDPKQRDGHWICLDQSGDVDQIEIYDHTQEHYILIDTKNKKITIECVTGDMDILVEKTIYMKCTDLKIEASNDIKATAGNNIEEDAGSTMKLTAGTLIEEKAGKITLN